MDNMPSEKKRLLLINYEFPPIGGGASNASYYLAQSFIKKGYEITVLTTYFPRDEKFKFDGELITVKCFRKYVHKARLFEIALFALKGFFAGRKWIRKNKLDGVVAFFGVPSGWIARRIAKKKKIPFVVSLRGADVPGFVERNLEWIHYFVRGSIMKVWDDAKYVIANSSGLRALALKSNDKNPIELIPNGVDTDFYKPDWADDKESFLAKYREEEYCLEKIKLLFVGRFSRQKGLLHLMKALDMLPKEYHKRIAITLIGDGPDKLAVLDSISSIQDSIEIHLLGWMDKENLKKAYLDHEVFIFPSLDEGMPNVVLEAMASGRPILGTRIAGTDELVANDVNGWLVAPASPKELADAIINICHTSLRELKEYAAASRLKAERRSWDSVADDYLSLIFSDNSNQS
jgi:glycogen synthase